MSNRIQELRREKGFSQEELGSKIGVSRQSVSKWEGDQNVPDLKNIIAMSDILDTTTDYLLKGIEPDSTIGKKTMNTLHFGFVVFFAGVSGLWAFTANRFRLDEIIFIVIVGAIIGLGMSIIIQIISKLFKNK